jgi:hypothetical protein
VYADRIPVVPTASPGFADIVGFGQDGVVILRNGISIQTFTAIKDFGYNAGGWRVDKHVRLVANMTNDSEADIIGFGDSYTFVSQNKGNNSFTTPVKAVLKDFAYNSGGWRVDKHIRYCADIRGVGRCDIVGFGDGGVVVSRNDGNLNFKPSYIALNDFGYNAGGWRLERHLRFLGDVTGDGKPDIVGFGENHVFIGRNNGNGTFAAVQPVINNFCYSAGGWRVEQHPRFIADLTGDGKVDVIGCGGAGVYASLNNGNGTFGSVKLVVNNFGTAQGWQVNQHPRYIADLTGDGRGDIIGFGAAGVWVSYNNGDGTFQPAKLVINNFAVQQGWQVSKHPRYVVDLTGDGCADVIGFGESNVYVSFNDGKGGFGPVQTLLSNFAFNGGQWSEDKTVRYLANLSRSR